jgi:hypothetical protein
VAAGVALWTWERGDEMRARVDADAHFAVLLVDVALRTCCVRG